MGALDFYTARGRCPACGREADYSGQTKFFAPEFDRAFHRTFAVGVAQPLEFSPELLESARVWERQWFRVRERGRAGHVAVLLDFDDLAGCECGTPFAVILELSIERAGGSGIATLEGLRILDARSEAVPHAVDFANAEFVALPAELDALGAAPEPERAARLSAALGAHFRLWLERFGR